MSGTDDAAVQIVFRADPMANRDKIIAALRKAGHLRTPGTVEMSRDRVGDAVWLMCEIDTEATEFHEDCCAYFRVALAAGADDGE